MKEAELKNKKNGLSGLMTTLVPVIGLVLVIVIFEIWTQGILLGAANLGSMINQLTVTVLVAIGAACTYGVGNIDVSLGASVCAAAVGAALVAVSTGNLFLSLLVCLGISLVLGLLKGLMAAYVQVPYFIFSVVLGSILSALVLVIMGNESTIYLANAAVEIPELSYSQLTVINIVVIVVYFAIGLFLFKFTGYGLNIRMLGGNAVAARQNGSNIVKTRVLAFLWAGLGIAFGAFLLMLRSQVVAYNTASSTGTDVMVAITLGGMPISGGPKTSVTAGLIGAATITVINSGLSIIGTDVGLRQVVRGIIFLVVVVIAAGSFGKQRAN